MVWDADVMITIDADLQDDPDKIPEMIEHYKNGCEIVYGVRSDRQTDFWFKRNTAESFYKLMNQMDVTMIPDSADFRLMSNRAVYALLKYSERNLFLRGLVPQLGFQTGKVYYCIRLVFIDAFTLVYRRCSALTAFDSVSCPTDIFKTGSDCFTAD